MRYGTYDSATTEAVNDDEAPDESEDSLDDTKDTGGKQRGVRAGDTNRLEDGGRAVISERPWSVLGRVAAMLRRGRTSN